MIDRCGRPLRNWIERELARQVPTQYEFTASISAQRVIDAIDQHWGRTVPNGEAGIYVQSVIPQQQVILLFGNQIRPRIFAARIDFQSPDPVSGTLWFFEAEDLADGAEAADQLRSDFARLIADLSPDDRILSSERGTAESSSPPSVLKMVGLHVIGDAAVTTATSVHATA
jgi:hypothetical protein